VTYWRISTDTDIQEIISESDQGIEAKVDATSTKPEANGLGLWMTRFADNSTYRLGQSHIQYESSRSGRRASGQSSSQNRRLNDLIEIIIHLHWVHRSSTHFL
jgi:hypothetical protein